MRIVVVRAGALGDVVLTLPALHALRQEHPEALIQVVGTLPQWNLAKGIADDVISFDHPRFGQLFTPHPGEDLLGWLQGADLLIAWTSCPLSPALFTATAIRHASPYPPPGRHASDWYVGTAGMAPSRREGIGSLLRLSEDERSRAGRLLPDSETVLLHPGAGAAWKRWPAESFARVAGALQRQGVPVALVAGEADVGATAEVQELSRPPLPLLPSLPPRHLAAVLARASLFIGNDSGVTHLAAAAGTPTIAIFGPTDPISWSPLGRTHILRACTRSASYQGEIRVCDDPGCLARVSPQQVLDLAWRLLPSGG